MSSVTSQIADALFRSGCLKFGKFRIKSGDSSPYYIDLSCLLSSPSDLGCVVEAVAGKILKIAASTNIDKLASIELKGALLLPSIAYKVKLPCLVTRKSEKKYGVTGRIAGGTVLKGEHVLFFDDVVSSGMSKLEGIRPLEELGAHVDSVMVVVDREQGGRKNLENLGYRFYALTRVTGLVKCLHESSYISKEQADAVSAYVRKP